MQISTFAFIYAVSEESRFLGSSNSVIMDFDFPDSVRLMFKLDTIVEVFC